tara:strand:- start:907 stop:1044 length:138 start_codon:yes stop_codon:yes gene_type:complete
LSLEAAEVDLETEETKTVAVAAVPEVIEIMVRDLQAMRLQDLLSS